MRTRSIVIIFGAAALFILALILVSTNSAAKPPISIGVLSYEPWAEKGAPLEVRVGITNRGFKIVRYNRINFDGDARLRTESGNGWTERDFGSASLVLPALLPSGADTSAGVMLPDGTLRWQIRYHVETASLAESVIARMPRKCLDRLRPLLVRLLPKKGRWQEVESAVFECPHNPQGRVNERQPLSSETDGTSVPGRDLERWVQEYAPKK